MMAPASVAATASANRARVDRSMTIAAPPRWAARRCSEHRARQCAGDGDGDLLLDERDREEQRAERVANMATRATNKTS